MRRSLAIHFDNRPGSVIRVALVLERRSYSIESLMIVPSAEGFSEMLITVNGDPEKFEQIVKQLSKLIDVLKVEEAVLPVLQEKEIREVVSVGR